MLKKFIRHLANKIRHIKYKKIINKGKNNTIKIPEWRTKVIIYGNNNTVEIAHDVQFTGSIYIGTPDCKTNNCIVKINEGTLSNGTCIRLLEDNSSVEIGKNCLLSTNINISCSDTHSILDSENNLINKGESIKIGDHVWIGMDAKISKNTTIPDNCIIGMGSIVTKKFTTPNTIIAGNPATIRKTNIQWSKLRPKQYLNSQK